MNVYNVKKALYAHVECDFVILHRMPCGTAKEVIQYLNISVHSTPPKEPMGPTIM